MQFLKPRRRFQPKARNVRSLWEFGKRQIFWAKFFFPPSFSYGHVEGSFYNPPEKNSTKVKDFSFINQIWQKSFFSNVFFPLKFPTDT